MMMSTAMVRISKSTHHLLRELATRKGESMQSILTKAIEEYRRQQIFEEAEAAYAALKNDPEAWKAEQEERAVWDKTLSDGLELDEQWDQEGNVIGRD